MAIAKQPTEIFMCNTSNIDSMRHGRPQTVMLAEVNIPTALQGELPNGVIVKLGDTKETTQLPEFDHVHSTAAVGSNVDGAIGKFIIVSPEIKVEQYRRIDNSIANHMLVANETYTAYELQLRDRIEYSQAYFDTTTQATLADKALAQGLIGNNTLFDMNENGELVAGGTSLRIVSVRYQRKPLMMAHGADGLGLGGEVAMVKVEVVK